MVVVDGERELLEVVAALHAGGGLADLLDGRQQEADEDGDDGDHHQQLDQRERPPLTTPCQTARAVGRERSHEQLSFKKRTQGKEEKSAPAERPLSGHPPVSFRS